LISIQIDFGGDLEIERQIGFKLSAVKDLTPAWKTCQAFLENYQKKVFDTGGVGGGFSYQRRKASETLEPWKELAESTKRRKQAKGQPLTPLIATGRMRRAFVEQDSSPDSIIQIRPLEFIYGVNEGPDGVFYGKFHQQGGPRLPKRPVLRITENVRQIIGDIIQGHIVKSGQARRDILFSDDPRYSAGRP